MPHLPKILLLALCLVGPVVAEEKRPPGEITLVDSSDPTSSVQWAINYLATVQPEAVRVTKVVTDKENSTVSESRQWEVALADVDAFAALLARFAEWHAKATRDRAPDFTKEVGQLAGQPLTLRWTDRQGMLVSPAYDDISVDDSRKIRIILLSAPESVRRTRVAEKAGRDYADKLK